MKKIILGICDVSSRREKRNDATTYKDVVKLIIIDPETQKDELEFPIITLKPNRYNRLSWDVVCDLLSPDNQKFLLLAGEEDNPIEGVNLRNYPDLTNPAFIPPRFCLTQQQRAIMNLAAEGLSAKQIAERLCLSYNTIKNHFTNIYDKIGVRSLPEAIELYLQYKERMN